MNNLKKIFKYILIVIVVISISIFTLPLPSIYKANYIEYYDINGELIKSEIKNKKGKYIYLNELNDYTKYAFIAFEDKRFYSHNGFDFLRIISSLYENISNASISSGASTITQQYARTLFLNTDKTLIRKIKEAYYTIRLESKYSKDEILEGYLNNIYLGHGCYGIECASLYYFNKSAKNLTLSESALIASIASSPNNASPVNNYDLAIKRKNKVLEAMHKEGYISYKDYIYSVSENPTINPNKQDSNNINYYLDRVKLEIKNNNLPLTKGVKVYTNLDLSLFYKIESLLSKYINGNHQTSIIILENNTNKIVFNIGGYDYNKSSYNRALYSSRQIGSTIKSFLYSFAIENNLGTATSFKSEKTTFKIKDHGTYSPSNSNNKYANKSINMEEAFATSDNIYATKLLLLLGSDNFIKYLDKFKLTTKNALPSIALGSVEFNLLELANAYSVFANGGNYISYQFIDSIKDSYNSTIYKADTNKEKILNNNTISIMKKLLSLPFKKGDYYTSSTMENYNIANMYGKTGSTKTDSYVIGINDKYTIAIWSGVDDVKNTFTAYQTPKKILKELSLIK